MPKKIPASYQFTDCRDFGHAWAWVTDDLLTPVRKRGRTVIDRQLVCRTCFSARRDTIVLPTYEVTARSYKYSDGYQVPGDGRVPASVFRGLAMKRRSS